MTQGPLTKVSTIVAGINLDISRQLNWGKGLRLEFLTPNETAPDGLLVQRILVKGFDRIALDEDTRAEGHTVIFRCVGPKDLIDTLRLPDLHARVDGETYSVADIPAIAPNEAQVYTLICKVRTIRKRFFDNTK